MLKISTLLFSVIGLTSANLKVMSPKSLRDQFTYESDRVKGKDLPMGLSKDAFNGFIKASYANFGYIPYGHNMIGHLHYHPHLKDHTLCTKVPEDEFNFSAMNPFGMPGTINSTDTLQNTLLNGLPPFILADRGGCSFVTKVRNIEDAGAAIAIVIDSSDEPIEDVVMSDDGTGAGIRIPSMLISKTDGQKLINFIKTASKEEIMQFAISASFDLSRPDNRVEYDVWLSSSSDRVLDFIQDFQKIDKKLGMNVLMRPHYKFWSCPECDEKFKEDHCFSDGEYCTTDSNHEQLTGREIMAEDIRQMCIWENSYQDQEEDTVENRQMFWNYMHSVHEQCYGSVNEDCSRLAHKDNGMDFYTTHQCVVDSFGGIKDYDVSQQANLKNEMIESEMRYYNKYGPATFPGIVINNQTFRGQLEIEAVLNGICAGFNEPPKMCNKYLNDYNINDTDLLFMKEGRHSVSHVFGICLGVMFVVLIILCFYRRFAKRQMKAQMNVQIETAVNQYLALSKEDSEAQNK